MAKVKGNRFPLGIIRGGLNQNKSSRWAKKGGFKAYFSKGSQRLSARRFRRTSWIHEDWWEYLSRLFTDAECAWKELTPELKELLKACLQSQGYGIKDNLDFYRAFKEAYMERKLNRCFQNLSCIHLNLRKIYEDRIKVTLELKAEPFCDTRKERWFIFGNKALRGKPLSSWLPYDHATVYVTNEITYEPAKALKIDKLLPKSNRTQITIYKSDVRKRLGDGIKYVFVNYNGIKSNFVDILIEDFPYQLRWLGSLYWKNLSTGVEKHVLRLDTGMFIKEVEKIPSYVSGKQLVAQLNIEDRTGTPWVDWDYNDVIIKVYIEKRYIVLNIYGTNGIDHNKVYYITTEGKMVEIADCPPNHPRISGGAVIDMRTGRLVKTCSGFWCYFMHP